MAIERAIILYQESITNVFAVDFVDPSKEGRGTTKRLIQSDAHTCEAFAKGLRAAGVLISSATCNEIGDVSDKQWVFYPR
jgi:hypothetical protein